MNKKLKMVLWVIVILAVIGLIGFCTYNFYLSKTEAVVHPEVSFELENYGTIKMELYPEYAPNTVANIIKLVENGYYTDKVINGKDNICLYLGTDSEGKVVNPKASLIDSSIEADSESDYEYSISGEFALNGYNKNTLSHEKGVVSLMRNNYSQYFQDLVDESYNSGNAQIGIMINDAKNLNGAFTAFGKITEGLDIVEKIYNEEKIKVDESATEETSTSIDLFENCPKIKSASVNTYGNDYGMPVISEVFDYNAYLNNYLSSQYSTQQ